MQSSDSVSSGRLLSSLSLRLSKLLLPLVCGYQSRDVNWQRWLVWPRSMQQRAVFSCRSRLYTLSVWH